MTNEKRDKMLEIYKKSSERIFAGMATKDDYQFVQDYQDYEKCDWNPGWEPEIPEFLI